MGDRDRGDEPQPGGPKRRRRAASLKQRSGAEQSNTPHATEGSTNGNCSPTSANKHNPPCKQTAVGLPLPTPNGGSGKHAAEAQRQHKRAATTRRKPNPDHAERQNFWCCCPCCQRHLCIVLPGTPM